MFSSSASNMNLQTVAWMALLDAYPYCWVNTTARTSFDLVTISLKKLNFFQGFWYPLRLTFYDDE